MGWFEVIVVSCVLKFSSTEHEPTNQVKVHTVYYITYIANLSDTTQSLSKDLSDTTTKNGKSTTLKNTSRSEGRTQSITDTGTFHCIEVQRPQVLTCILGSDKGS